MVESDKPVWTPEPKVLLSGDIPEPMHGVNPRSLSGTKWWRETKEAAYKSTDYHCLACAIPKAKVRGARKHLEAHEMYDVDWAIGRSTYVRTVPLCPYCHSYIHGGRLVALAEKGKTTFSKLVAVLSHGNDVLASIGLIRLLQENRMSLVAWEDWRLVFDGKEYPPKYKSEEHWRASFS